MPRASLATAGATPDPAWRPPLASAGSAAEPAEALAERLAPEVLLLRGARERWVARAGRTTVGLSRLPIDECARYAADWLFGKAPASPREGFSAPLALRFTIDDPKAIIWRRRPEPPSRRAGSSATGSGTTPQWAA
jgi:hypothetical protein